MATIEHVRNRREQHARPVGGRDTLCGIDTSRWTAETIDEEAVSCTWCKLRLKHDVIEPTAFHLLPDAAIKEGKRILAKQRKAAS